MTLGRRGSTTLEFALIAPTLLLLLFATVEYARMLWTWQAMQLAGDQTARCVAIGATACATPAAYAVTTAATFGASGLTAGNVVIDTQSASSSPVVCTLPGSNKAARVKLTLNFSTPIATLVPFLGKTLTTNSCYPTTGS